MTYEEILKFHGHECPGIAIGYRMTKAALDALSQERSADEELVAIVENDACGVDALQCLTGCTFGKGNLVFHDYGKQVYTLYSRCSGEGVRVSFIRDNVPSGVQENRDDFTHWILSAPQERMLTVKTVSIDTPPMAVIRSSVKCDRCGEDVMESRVRQVDGMPCCIPCSIGDESDYISE